MRKTLFPLAFLVLLGAGAAPVPAQARFGTHVSWGDDTDLGIGGRVAFGLASVAPKVPIEGQASFDYFFPDEAPGVDLTYWEINANVLYLIPGMTGPVKPYVGGGLNIAHASVQSGLISASDTDGGLNLIGGTKWKLRASRISPFAEVRIELGGGEQFVLAGGILF